MTKPILHFAHANSYPAGTYRQFFQHLGARFDVRALEMHAHHPDYPVDDGWRNLARELIAQLERYDAPVVLCGHSLGGMLSMMVAKKRPDLVRCLVMLDSPVVAGWRAFFWRSLKHQPWADRYTPAKHSARRRELWPSKEAAHAHFAAKPGFAAWAPGVLADYIEAGTKPHPEGVTLRFTREIETAIYRTLPHHLGRLVRTPFPVPAGFIAGTRSYECRQAGLEATHRLVGKNFVNIEGGHLFPMERPQESAAAVIAMVDRLLEGRDLA
ncbi:alpha/beta fold hydrolase [Massilia sp. TS11]|uniref:alpha/beta fold hydrolase n=1 Tax=Massilia sp. TS11 TaxID=2908003 RepID=UPI001EDC4E03|nr:alpha/beta hydrolase [Massilia sp. TS11]MCG2584605.1 alpha/beta hydrolase [Massilia sp. TS11]